MQCPSTGPPDEVQYYCFPIAYVGQTMLMFLRNSEKMSTHSKWSKLQLLQLLKLMISVCVKNLLVGLPKYFGAAGIILNTLQRQITKATTTEHL